MISLLAETWRVFRKNFLPIAVITLAIWLPFDLLDAYLLKDSWRLSSWISMGWELVFGIMATAGVIHLVMAFRVDERTSPTRALAVGLGAWPRMFWTRLLCLLLVLFGLVCLMVPGIYLLVRLAVLDIVVVHEHRSGWAAIARCWELGRGKFWLTVRLLLLPVGLFVAAMVLLVLLWMVSAKLLPELYLKHEFWLVLAYDVLGECLTGFLIVVQVAVYRRLCAGVTDENASAALSA